MSILNDDARFGVSALDISHREYAEKDELMLRERDGQMIYKRSDGQVVAFNSDYTRKDVIEAVARSHKATGLGSNESGVYYTIDITEQTDLSESSSSLEVPYAFRVAKSVNGFYFRVRGTDVTNSIISYLNTFYNKEYPENNAREVLLTVTVVNDENPTGFNFICEGSFNDLNFVQLPISESESLITIKKISFPMATAAYSDISSTVRDKLTEYNYSNTKIEVSMIDLITFESDINSSYVGSIDDMVNFKEFFNLEELKEEEKKNAGNGIIVSETQPDFDCIWAKVIKDTTA